ncbi:MAG: Cys-tRNA(Pro) deacylase [Alphaproteobacteria bacterium]|nr:Cys-tRNA(Pro) deacylase [Alphaproteobacteria bacterium]MBU1515497.1 Cys-tRNA(Pro) deacylase [Alphaproteobacteria bacterium]MBU2095495.1 Cys-tRNA(Pro) deacylase [Alphaproteobacteria bacterium]MBU2150736.1 Cys-tRNA(Pro) deacylase [Alphaproteobacteria bacterium]MBU2307001.1 Cys-tRNA(Pro) deacylase [Alphaproteobacteria bacterium]
MSRTTPATLALDKAGVAYALATYDYDSGAERVGLQAAEALGAPPGEVLKTLMVKADGKPVCVILASDREVSMKKLAAAVGAKSAEMMKPADAERMTGYRVGGVSAFGQKRIVPTVIDADAAALLQAFVNAGQRGLQARLVPADLVRALGATVAAIS